MTSNITEISPEWGKTKTKLEKKGKCFNTAGVASIVLGVALLILGIIICASANPAGAAPILVSLPLFYIGYNSIVFGKNLKNVTENPEKKDLLKRTFGLGPLYDFGAKKLGIPTK